MICLSLSVCANLSAGAPRGQRSWADREAELQEAAVSHQRWVLGMESGPLEEWSTLLTTAPSLQSYLFFKYLQETETSNLLPRTVFLYVKCSVRRLPALQYLYRINIFLCALVFRLPVCMCTACAQRRQKMVLDLLVLVLQMVLSAHVGAGNQTQSTARAAIALNY